MKYYVLVSVALLALNFTNLKKPGTIRQIIGGGKMPNMVIDHKGSIHLVFGKGDSIMYSTSTNRGQSFSYPGLVFLLPNLVASAMRGPQIAATSNGLVIIACNKKGDIFSFKNTSNAEWRAVGKVNDVDTVAKEGLMALSGDGETAYAVWLDIRDKHNKIFGARSTDGGKSWSKNLMIYTSPDSTVCECCKPSVVVKGKNVFVMFRNWLNGSRDIYLLQSKDGGINFGEAQKLGRGNWALKGCPMDGGGLAVDKDGNVQTVWKRENKIYSCEPGKQEMQLGEGRNCTVESISGKNVYSWAEAGDVVVMKPNGIRQSLGKGILPVIKAVDDHHAICVWENENQIHASVVGF